MQQPNQTTQTQADDPVFHEQARLLFKAAPTSVGGTFLGIFFVVLLLWGVTDRTTLLAWASAFALVNSLRGLHARYYLRHPEHLELRRWSRQFVFGALTAATFWGSTGVYLFPVGQPLHQIMLALILLVAGTVGITNIAILRSLILPFILITNLPIIVHFYISAHESMNLMGTMMSIATVLFLIGGNRVYRITEENIRHRLEATESERRLRESRQHLALHVQRTPLGVIEWDTEMNVVEWNQAAERLFGYSREEALGKNAYELFIPNQSRAKVKEVVKNLLDGAGGFYSLNENLTKDGRTILCEWFNTPLIDDSGEVIGLASQVHDVTDRVRAERLKNEFVSTVSHELRTPLTSLRGSLGLVLGGVTGGVEGKTRELLQLADNNAKRLHNLINDILDVQKIESGQVDFHFVPTPIKTVVEQALLANGGYAQQCKVRLHLRDCAEGVEVMADGQRLLQVLDNLVSNAIKFSPEAGQVEVDVQLRGERVRISVSDQGPGVPQDFVPKLFLKFSQADGSSTRNFAGTGLGLSIAKGIVEHHHGQIGYEPILPHGSRFYFELARFQG